MLRLLLALLLLAGCAVPVPVPIPARSPAHAVVPGLDQLADSGAFVVRLGNDTLVLERFVRTVDSIRAEALIRSPATVLRRYHLKLNSSGGIAQFETVDVAIGTDTVTRRETLDHIGDTAVHVIMTGDSARETRFALPAGALPFLNLVQWPNELIIARVGAAVGDSVIVPYLTGRSVTNFVVRRLSADSVTIRHPSRGVSRVHVDAAGRLLHLDASATTLKLAVERQAWLPLEQLASSFAARDANLPRRELSPRGKAAATVGGASITLDYGRPSKRGREIFGNVVPFGQLWRTGANQATQFTTDRALILAGQVIPAGSYSIFSIPQADAWTIIINSETGQTGTAHNAARDFVRVPAQVRELPEVVEQFTIRIDESNEGGIIRFQWDRGEAVLPFKVAQ